MAAKTGHNTTWILFDCRVSKCCVDDNRLYSAQMGILSHANRFQIMQTNRYHADQSGSLPKIHNSKIYLRDTDGDRRDCFQIE